MASYEFGLRSTVATPSHIVVTWANFIGYQAVWFVSVLSAGRDRAWPGPLAAAAFIVWQIFCSAQPKRDWRMLLFAVLFGALIDGGLAAFGLLHYSAARPALPPGGAPLWILGLWAAFSTTFTRSLGWLLRSPLLALLFGAVGGPLAYLGAARGTSAVSFVDPAWRGVLWLAIGWGASMLWFARETHGLAGLPGHDRPRERVSQNGAQADTNSAQGNPNDVRGNPNSARGNRNSDGD